MVGQLLFALLSSSSVQFQSHLIKTTNVSCQESSLGAIEGHALLVLLFAEDQCC